MVKEVQKRTLYLQPICFPIWRLPLSGSQIIATGNYLKKTLNQFLGPLKRSFKMGGYLTIFLQLNQDAYYIYLDGPMIFKKMDFSIFYCLLHFTVFCILF